MWRLRPTLCRVLPEFIRLQGATGPGMSCWPNFRLARPQPDGRWFHFTDGARVGQAGLRERIAKPKRLGGGRGTPMDRALKMRIGRIFKSIAAGSPATGAAAIAA